MREFSAEEQTEYLNSRPKKLMGSMVWITDPSGKLLLVKPAYKAGWSLVGGTVDLYESPLDCAVRETQEETGLSLPKERLSFFGFRYISPQQGRDDHTQVFFKAELTAEEAKAVRIVDPQEIAEQQFVSLDEISKYSDVPRMFAVAALAKAQPQSFYMHNETLL